MFRIAKVAFWVKNSHENIKTWIYGGQSNSKAGSRPQNFQKQIFSSIYSSRRRPPSTLASLLVTGRAVEEHLALFDWIRLLGWLGDALRASPSVYCNVHTFAVDNLLIRMCGVLTNSPP